MKKLGNVYFCIIFIFVILITWAIFTIDNHNYKVIYVDNLNEDVVTIYCLNEANEIVCTDVCMNSKNLYYDIFNIYNEYQNKLPSTCYSPLGGIVTINKIECSGNDLYININGLPSDCDIALFTECLKKTYSLYNITKITIETKLSILVI